MLSLSLFIAEKRKSTKVNNTEGQFGEKAFVLTNLEAFLSLTPSKSSLNCAYATTQSFSPKLSRKRHEPFCGEK
jgi:hypothetical protein